MKKIFVCSPSECLEESKRVVYAANFILLGRQIVSEGNMPILPHIYFPMLFSDKENGGKKYKEFVAEYAKMCDECWVIGEEFTESMLNEMKIATENNKPIKYFTEQIFERLQKEV